MVYLLLVDGFEEIEGLTPVDILRRSDIDITTVGVYSKEVIGAHDIKVEADILIQDVNVETMRMIILPGGAGHTKLEESTDVQELINYAIANNKYVSAICAAPSILGKKGILNGKNATCFPGYEKYLYGANVVNEKVVVDGRIITSKGAGCSSEFSFAIVEKLSGKETADKVKGMMQY